MSGWRWRNVVVVLWVRIVRSGVLGVLEGVSRVMIGGMPLLVVAENLFVLIVKRVGTTVVLCHDANMITLRLGDRQPTRSWLPCQPHRSG